MILNYFLLSLKLEDILLHSCPQDYWDSCPQDYWDRPLTISFASFLRFQSEGLYGVSNSDRSIQEGELLPKIFDSSLRRGEASADLHIIAGVSREVVINTVALEFAVST